MDTAFLVAHDLLIALVLSTWAIGALWVATDARRRTSDRGKVVRAAAFAGALPLVGVVVYLCARPPQTLAERQERELARRLLERELDGGDRCLVCRTPLETSFLRCPTCAIELRTPCPGCAAPIELTWRACPFCAVDLTAPARHTAVRRETSADRAERRLRAA